MHRRSVLKQMGATGVGVVIEVGTDSIEAREDSELEKTKNIFSEISFHVKNSATEFPLIASCRELPQHTIEEQNKNKIFLNRTGNSEIDVDKDDVLVTHNGIKKGGERDITFNLVPFSANTGGSPTLIAGSESQTIKIEEQSKHELILSMQDANVSINKGESAKNDLTTEIRYGRDQDESTEVTIELEASHRGKVDILSHPDHYLFPKNDKWIGIMREMVRENSGANEYIVRKHREVIELIPQWSDR